MKILICDDDPTTLSFLDGMLKKMNFTPINCKTGGEALQKLCGPNPPKMAILDWLLPDYSGLDICRAVREINNIISIHLIILTIKNQSKDIAEGLKAGANDYITKPFDPEELQARVEVGRQIVNLKDELRTITGLLAICSWCKKVRTEDQGWVSIEEYVEKHSYAQFSHGGCPECLARLK